jgi:hypothetical protein
MWKCIQVFFRNNIILLVLLAALFGLASCKSGAPQESLKSTTPQTELAKIAFEWNKKMFSVNIDGSNLTNLTPENGIIDRLPVWSPDGSKLAFLTKSAGQTQEEFCVMTINDKNRIKFQLPFTHRLNLDKTHSFPLWSPKGDKLAFWYDGYVYVSDSDGNHLITVNYYLTTESKGDWWKCYGEHLYSRFRRKQSGQIDVRH